MSSDLVNPLDDLIARGAPRHVAGLADEWRAATEGCAVFPAAHRALARVTGDDRVSFLHGMLTNDVRGLAPGHGMPAAFLTASGQVVADLRLYCDEDGFDIDCASWRLEHLRAALDKYVIADDVEIEPSRVREPLVCLEGPASADLAAAVAGVPREMERFAIATGRFGDEPVRVCAVADGGGSGRMIAGAPALRAALAEACVAAGGVPAGLATLDVLRVEAGIAWAGVDMDEDTLLLEIGLPEVISRTKGCYLGQEVVERVSARGQVNRTLAAFAIDAAAADLPDGPLPVVAEGAAVGRVTSRVFSPAIGGTLGLGLLHRKGREAAALHVAAGDGRFACRVVEFPRTRS